MKPLFFCLSVSLLALCHTAALCQTDSLSAGDTIATISRHNLFGPHRTYRFHLATDLISAQLESIIERSPDEDTRQLLRTYRRQSALAGKMVWLGYGAMLGTLWAIQRPETATNLVTTSLLGVTGIVLVWAAPVERSERTFRELVLHHNHTVRAHFGGYYEPMFDIRPQRERLTLIDTVQVKRHLWAYHFTYRGVSVDPSVNLKPAFEQLKNAQVTNGARYVRTINNLTGAVMGLAMSALTGHLVFRAVRNSRSPTVRYPLNRSILYGSAGLVGVSVVGIIHGNHSEARTMKLYNQMLREKEQ